MILKSFKNLAQLYIEKEISVTPIDNKKIPILGRNWNEKYLDEVLDPHYDTVWSNAGGIGLLTGEPSGIIVLDIDITNDDPSPEKIKIRDELLSMLPPIFSGRTGSKRKPPARFYKYEGQSTERFTAIDVEILSTKVHCALPPSYHSDGNLYEWVGHSLLDIDIDDLPCLDEEIIVWLREQNLKMKNEIGTAKLLRSEKGRCKSGSHNYLSRIGVALRYENHTAEHIVTRLLNEDAKINEGEDSLYFLCKTRKWRTNSSEENAKAFVAEIFKNHQPNPVHEKYPTKKDGFFLYDKEKKIPDYVGLNEYMKNELCLKAKDDCAFIFNGTHYEPISKQGIENKIYHLTNLSAGPSHLGNMSKMARVYCHYDDDFINPVGAINLKNGILYTEKMELRPHDKNKFFTYRLNHNYTPSTETPVFDKFLNLLGSGDKAKEELIKEYIGYILSGCDYSKFNKVLILDGAGSNGKTSLINIIENLVGVDNVASESLTSLNDNRFSTYSLVGKMVNFCAEEPKEAFSASGILKKLTGNDPVMVEQKHMKSFPYINYAKFIISYNEVPYLADRTSGMKRRLMIVPCTTDLEKNPELKIANLKEQIEPEYGAIMNKCLLAFKNVQERGDFTIVQSGIDRYKEIEMMSDPVLDFVSTKLVFYDDLSPADRTTVFKYAGSESAVSAEELWPEFLKFTGGTKMAQRGFEMKLSAILKREKNIEKTRETKSILGRKYVYKGVILAN